jgi:predicted patatin/cPLA2 family phospholipase
MSRAAPPVVRSRALAARRAVAARRGDARARTAVAAAPPADHPVMTVLRERAAGGSRPGARDDPHTVALVLEGGGMRGVVSAGMAAAFERLGLTGTLDLVVGSSAGALNGAALLAGVAGPCAVSYATAFATREFVNPARLLRGRPALDVAFALRHAAGDLDSERHARTVTSAIPLHCLAVDVETAQPVVFSGMETVEELFQVLLATSRMPWVGGEPVEIRGRRYLDGGLADPIPVESALAAGATHVLVLQTRPYGVPRTTGVPLVDRVIERHLRRLNPGLAALYRDRVACYDRIVTDIGRRSAAPGDAPPHVLGLRPQAGAPVVSRLERRPEVLARAAADAERLVEAALGAP